MRYRRVGLVLVLVWLLLAGVVSILPVFSAEASYIPVDDAYVHEAYPDTNYGSSEDLKLERLGTSSEYSQVYLKFNLSDLEFSSITSVKLRLYFEEKSNIADPTNVKVHLVSDDTWDEDSITWNNKPGYSGEVSINIYGETPPKWIEIDITDLVADNITADDKILSLALSYYCSNVNSYVIFSSKEGDNPPQLLVSYAPEATTTVTQTETTTVTETVYITTTTENVTITSTTTVTDYVTETQTATVTQTDVIYTTETAYITETSTVTQTITDVITETATTTVTQTEWANQTVTVTTTMTPTTTVTIWANETVTMTEYGNSTAPEIDYQALAETLMPIVLIVGVLGTLLSLLLQSTSFRRGD